jgi:hypothetical protein
VVEEADAAGGEGDEAGMVAKSTSPTVYVSPPEERESGRRGCPR